MYTYYLREFIRRDWNLDDGDVQKAVKESLLLDFNNDATELKRRLEIKLFEKFGPCREIQLSVNELYHDSAPSKKSFPVNIVIIDRKKKQMNRIAYVVEYKELKLETLKDMAAVVVARYLTEEEVEVLEVPECLVQKIKEFL